MQHFGGARLYPSMRVTAGSGRTVMWRMRALVAATLCASVLGGAGCGDPLPGATTTTTTTMTTMTSDAPNDSVAGADGGATDGGAPAEVCVAFPPDGPLPDGEAYELVVTTRSPDGESSTTVGCRKWERAETAACAPSARASPTRRRCASRSR
jgi:hypothetical protein